MVPLRGRSSPMTRTVYLLSMAPERESFSRPRRPRDETPPSWTPEASRARRPENRPGERVTTAGLDGHAGGLVEGDDVIVLEEDRYVKSGGGAGALVEASPQVIRLGWGQGKGYLFAG